MHRIWTCLFEGGDVILQNLEKFWMNMEMNIDWHKLTFKLNATKTMFLAKTSEDGKWMKGSFLPFGPISMSPAAVVLNYGQGLIEGLKAHRLSNGQIVLFRPEENAKRFTEGAERLCIPPVTLEFFLEIMHELVRQNEELVPPSGLGSLYIRPCLWGTSPILGVAPATEYTFVVYCSPVGNYFKGGEITPVKFEICDSFHRSAPLGVGHTKFIGNYAPTLLPSMQAKEQGFAGNIYLDAAYHQYIEEAGIANVFCIKGNRLLTPRLSQSILSGVTRASVIELAREVLHLEVVEEPLAVQVLLEADECFCTGTAAIVTPIGSLTYQGREKIFQGFSTGPYTRKLYDNLVGIQTGGIDDTRGWLVEVQNTSLNTSRVLEDAYTM